MNRLRSRLTYANVISTLCLFLLLGGGMAFAKAHLGRNSVGPRQLKRNSVTTPKIRRGAVTRAKLNPSAISALASPLQTVTVEGASLILAPGEFDGAPTAECPPGYVVVGTGFVGGVAEPGFVLAFGTFVGGFFANSSSIVTESNVQAICGRQAAGGATASSRSAYERFKRRVARAEAALGGA